MRAYLASHPPTERPGEAGRLVLVNGRERKEDQGTCIQKRPTRGADSSHRVITRYAKIAARACGVAGESARRDIARLVLDIAEIGAGVPVQLSSTNITVPQAPQLVSQRPQP